VSLLSRKRKSSSPSTDQHLEACLRLATSCCAYIPDYEKLATLSQCQVSD